MTPPFLVILAATCFLASQTTLASSVADFHALAKKCAPSVPSEALAPIIKVESHFNPYAIGVVGGRLARQPATKEEAITTAKALEAAGHRFSAGIGQVYRGNWAAYGLTADTVFEPCGNLRASSGIFEACHVRAKAEFQNEQLALQAAYSCYYSNNFTTGFKPDFAGQPSYVDKVMLSAAVLKNQPTTAALAIPFIPNKSEAGTTSATQVTTKPVGPEQVVFDNSRSISMPETAPVVVEQPARLTTHIAPAAALAEPNPYVYSPQDSAAALVY